MADEKEVPKSKTATGDKMTVVGPVYTKDGLSDPATGLDAKTVADIMAARELKKDTIVAKDATAPEFYLVQKDDKGAAARVFIGRMQAVQVVVKKEGEADKVVTEVHRVLTDVIDVAKPGVVLKLDKPLDLGEKMDWTFKEGKAGEIVVSNAVNTNEADKVQKAVTDGLKAAEVTRIIMGPLTTKEALSDAKNKLSAEAVKAITEKMPLGQTPLTKTVAGSEFFLVVQNAKGEPQQVFKGQLTVLKDGEKKGEVQGVLTQVMDPKNPGSMSLLSEPVNIGAVGFKYTDDKKTAIVITSVDEKNIPQALADLKKTEVKRGLTGPIYTADDLKAAGLDADAVKAVTEKMALGKTQVTKNTSASEFWVIETDGAGKAVRAFKGKLKPVVPEGKKEAELHGVLTDTIDLTKKPATVTSPDTPIDMGTVPWQFKDEKKTEIDTIRRLAPAEMRQLHEELNKNPKLTFLDGTGRDKKVMLASADAGDGFDKIPLATGIPTLGLKNLIG